MPNKIIRLLLTYFALTVIVNIVLVLLDEARPDSYVSVNILCFYVSYALFTPEKRSRTILFIHIALLSVFVTIIAYRIYQILAG